MPIRKLLLPLTGTAAGEGALTTALLIARKWDAHLTALHVRVDSRDVAPLAGEGLSGAMIEDMMTATDKESTDRGSAVRAMFDRFVQEHGVVGGPPHRGAGAPHPEAGDDVSSSDALHAVLFDSGRPVLIAPQVALPSIGARICLAWNGTAESAAAVLAALPWMQRAQAVRVLAADEYQRRGPDARALSAYLDLHGIHVEIAQFRPVDREVGRGLLMAAREFGADMLAMGAYSHSRLRQLILGGVTRHVLENATLPVLMCR